MSPLGSRFNIRLLRFVIFLTTSRHFVKVAVSAPGIGFLIFILYDFLMSRNISFNSTEADEFSRLRLKNHQTHHLQAFDLHPTHCRSTTSRGRRFHLS